MRLNNYCLEVAKKLGKMPHAIKTKIIRWALDEWLEKYGSDYDIPKSKFDKYRGR